MPITSAFFAIRISLPVVRGRARLDGRAVTRLTRELALVTSRVPSTIALVLLTNGRIHTMDERDRIVDTLVVRDGRIAFGGRRDDVSPNVGEDVIDLGGRAVLPGLTDAHAHLGLLAQLELELDVGSARSEADAARRVADRARSIASGEWITGRGWDETAWARATFPTRASLDAAAPRHPVALVRVDGHATWVNGEALLRAGIDRHTADPDGGLIVRDASGEPTGVLVDVAQDVVRRIVPRAAESTFDAAVGRAIARCLASGLTGVHEMGADLYGLGAYRRLIDRGRFSFRVHAAVRGREAWSHYRERGPEVVGDGALVVAGLKLWLDGALGSRGAALHDAYCDDPGNRGLLLMPPDEVERLTREALARGFQICVHAIGDRANTLVLDAFARVRARPDRALVDPRWRVEHAQVVRASDLPRFTELGALPSMQPTHCISDMRWAADRLGPDRLAGAYAWRSILDTGTIIAGGSDFPVEDPNPFLGIHAAVTRRPRRDDHPGWQPEQRMTRDEAVRAFTSWNAYASRSERELGALDVGKRADLVVLTDDVFTCDERAIATIAPVLTLVGGTIAFEQPGWREG